jgi:hypothetical protein
MTELRSDSLRRFIFAKHHGLESLELRHDKGLATQELVFTWDRETVDAARAAQEKPDPAAVDIVHEVRSEAVAYCEALGNGAVLFSLRSVRKDGTVIRTRPVRIHPTQADKGRAVVDAETFDRVVSALLKSNQHVVDSSAAISEGAARLVKAQAEVCESLSKLVNAGIASEPVTHAILTDEEREEVITRTALIKSAINKLPDIVDLGVALAAKFAKLPTVDATPAAAANGVAS